MAHITAYPALAQDKKNKKGECAVYIKVLFDNQFIKRIPTKVYIDQKHWDKNLRVIKNTYPHAIPQNKLISRKETEIKNIVLPLQTTQGITVTMVRDALKGRNPDTVLSVFNSFIEHLETIGKDGKSLGEPNTIIKWKRERNRLARYAPDVTFDQITIGWLEGYERHCAGYLKKGTSLPITMKLFLYILKKASNKKLFDLRDIAEYKPPTYKDPVRPYLTLEQTDAIWDGLVNNKFVHVKSMREVAAFFLSECWGGFRFGDWGTYKIETIIKEKKLKLFASKNKEPVYLPLSKSPRLQKLLQYISDNNLKFSLTEQKTNDQLKIIAGICGIDLRLSTHIGRHTCATLLLEMGHEKSFIAQWLGVSERTIEIYAKYTRRALVKDYDKLGGL